MHVSQYSHQDAYQNNLIRNEVISMLAVFHRKENLHCCDAQTDVVVGSHGGHRVLCFFKETQNAHNNHLILKRD